MPKRFSSISLGRYISIVKKEIIQIKKDPASLAIALVLPVMLLFLLGYAVSSEVENMDIAIWDQNKTQESRNLIQQYGNSHYFTTSYHVTSYEEVDHLLDNGKIGMAIVIPPNFSKQIPIQEASIQLLIDGSDPNIANTALKNARLISQHTSLVIQKKQLNNQGVQEISQPIKEESRVFYNPDMDMMKFNIPGLIGLIMQEVILILTAFSLVREKERGTMEQLIVTPIKPSELILGKLTPYTVIGFISFLFVLISGVLWFGVPIQGSIPLLILLSILFLITTLAMGILVSTIAKNQLQAMQIAFAIILPSVIISGFVFPREPMPFIIQAMGGFIPLTYFLEILRGIFLKGIGIEELWKQTLILLTFTVILCIATTLSFKKRLK